MKYTILSIGLLCLLVATDGYTQAQSQPGLDSLELHQVSIQDTFLLRVIPEYLAQRLREPREKRLQQKGVLIVTIPRVRRDTLVCYRIRAEYDNYSVYRMCSVSHPLFYAKVGDRYVIVCDEWTGSLVPVSRRSLQQAIDTFSKAGWLDVLSSELESSWEIHSTVYCWHPNR